ncbi:ABC transporter permease [Cohnella yongneupensis]|uniref:ABC transporter permease n=1 Tax=Cohnella yongneupensis TaxID=425006 RepID=A0ABW0R096_9BACL
MKSYGALSGRYLKQQRRRALLTVIGIILSVALISAISTMGQAVKDNLISNTKYENGSFHFSYQTATADFANELRNNVLVDQIGKLSSGSTTELPNKTTTTMTAVNADGFDLLPIHLQEGRYPQASNELALEQWLFAQLPSKPAMGGTLTLNDLDGKSREYTIVGILKNQKTSQIDHASRVYTLLDDRATASSNLQLFLTFKPGVAIADQLPHFEQLNDSFATNGRLLSLLGESSDKSLNRALIIIFGTLIGLVVLSTIAVIYNAFHIAVLERIRQFGLLRTLGATPRQIRNLVLREATMLSAISIPLGLAIGWGGLWLAIWLMTHNGINVLQMDSFHITFHWWIMGLSVAVGLFAVYVAAWLPARKASSVSPVEAAKGAGSIVRESYRRMRIPSLLQLMGVEGKMASSNIRRNKAKFRITTFSIAVSITLFIVFHYFTQQALELGVDTTENTKIGFEINAYSQATYDSEGQPIQTEAKDRLTADQLKQLAAIDGVDTIYGNYDRFGANAWLQPQLVNSRFLERTETVPQQKEWQGTDRTGVFTELELYDDARLQEARKYLIDGTADPKQLAAEDGVVIAQTVKPYIRSSNKREQMDMTTLKVGDTFPVELSTPDGKTVMREVKVAGILSQSPFNAAYPENHILVIGTRQTFEKLYKDTAYSEGASLHGVKIAVKDGADTDALRSELEVFVSRLPTGGQLIDVASEKERDRQFALQMQIFVYSFLIIIGTIGSLNIINTVQTNLLLRRREIGLLQSVGMTLGQVRRMASAEGIWFGVIGGFWGVGLGAAICYFLYKQLNTVQGIPFVFPWGGALIASGCAIAVGLLSVQSPLRRMNKASLIDRLREE